MDRINWPRVRDILISIICVGIIFWASWSILGQFVHAIILLLLAMAIAYLVTPLVNFLHRYIPRALAALLVFLAILALLGGLCYALIFSLIQQVQYFTNNLPDYFSNLPQTYNNFQTWLVQQGIPQSNITDTLNNLQGQVKLFLDGLVSNVLTIVFFVTDVLVNILLVVVLSFYLTVDGKRIRNSLVSIAPRRSMPHVLLFEDALNRVVGNYIRGQLTLALLIGLAASLGCTIFQMGNYALIVGVMAFLFETIPMVGPALASIPALLISLLLPEPFPRTIYVLIYFICVQMVESNILGPRIVGHAVGLHPVASILALIIGAQLFGPFGALLATPIVAAFWVVITSLYRSIRGVSADEILASGKKRSSWIRPRNQDDASSSRPRRLHFMDTLHLKSSPGSKGSEEKPRSVNNTEHIDLMRPIPSAAREEERGSASEVPDLEPIEGKRPERLN
ncbi:MAG TPA: AI-2E family transporter [Ktedonobacteraceae bacterium]|nr:AI-2E family transporter [Ktedonobacteraceae bacterium]